MLCISTHPSYGTQCGYRFKRHQKQVSCCKHLGICRIHLLSDAHFKYGCSPLCATTPIFVEYMPLLRHVSNLQFQAYPCVGLCDPIWFILASTRAAEVFASVRDWWQVALRMRACLFQINIYHSCVGALLACISQPVVFMTRSSTLHECVLA